MEGTYLHGHFGGCQVLLSSGMGRQELDLFEQKGVEVVVGVPDTDTEHFVWQRLTDRHDVLRAEFALSRVRL